MSRMRRFAVGARLAWQDAQQRMLTDARRESHQCPWWPWTMGSLVATPTSTWPPHGAVGACQVHRKGPEPYAIDCVLAYLDSWGLVEVTLKADNEPAIQALADGVRTKRGERTMVEKSPKYSHQSNGVAENAVRRIESLTRTYVYVLQRKLSY